MPRLAKLPPRDAPPMPPLLLLSKSAPPAAPAPALSSVAHDERERDPVSASIQLLRLRTGGRG